jgi:hypothetical protein
MRDIEDELAEFEVVWDRVVAAGFGQEPGPIPTIFRKGRRGEFDRDRTIGLIFGTSALLTEGRTELGAGCEARIIAEAALDAWLALPEIAKGIPLIVIALVAGKAAHAAVLIVCLKVDADTCAAGLARLAGCIIRDISDVQVEVGINIGVGVSRARRPA